VELDPDGLVPRPNGFGGGNPRFDVVWPSLEGGEVSQAEGDVLHEDVEVEPALSIRQRRVDLAGLRVHEVGLDPVSIASEQRVGQRAVAPVDAAAMEVDEEQRHGVQQSLAIAGAHGPEPHQQAPVLHRVAQVLRHQDGIAPVRALGEAHGADGREAGVLEVAQDLVLAFRNAGRQLLQRIDGAAPHQESDEVPRRAHGQLADGVVARVPPGERLLPRQLEQCGDLVAQSESGKRHVRGRGRGSGVGRLIRVACACRS
jgi:hypothetical protein